MRINISILLLGIVFLVGCSATAIEYGYGTYKEEVCTGGVFKKKKCKVIDRHGWAPKNKIRLNGFGVKVDFKNRTAEGSSVASQLPTLKMED
jgi:hypothetical protein